VVLLYVLAPIRAGELFLWLKNRGKNGRRKKRKTGTRRE
jgi:hypothetical protein